ncbi:MAG: biotin transporter BioY [Actinobacteria bacterium]|nr:biotin transporter BioY [Actinomycetota bacterium]
MTRSRLLPFVRAALVAALIAASALVTVPIGPVPVTLQVLVIAVAVLVLSPAEAAAAVGLYLLIGAVGMPVFSGGGAGAGVLAGPTGGFLFGFFAGALAGAAIRRAIEATGGQRRGLLADIVALVVLVLVTYVAGLAQFAAVSGRSIADAFAVAVAPFVVIDLAKAAVAMLVARALRKAGLGDRVPPPA